MGFFQGLLGGGKAKGGQTVASALSFQTSSYGAPIPLCYGTNRMAGNILWYGNFQSFAQPAAGGGKGGIVGGGGKNGSGQYTYSTGVALGLCEGPIQGVNNVYVDKNLTTLPALGLNFFNGSYSQMPWSYLTANYTAQTAITTTIPATGPYTIIAPNFISDSGVISGEISVPFTQVDYPNQVYNQYSEFQNVAYFDSSNAGEQVAIQYYSPDAEQYYTATVAIPNVLPYTIALGYSDGDGYSYNAIAITAINQAYVPVSGSPAAGQYSLSGATYTFAAANAGEPITITYQTSLGVNHALSYHGIAYVASSVYQLGNTAQLPNNNFEVQGVYSGSVQQQIVGEQDTIPNSPYQVTVQYAAQFISDGGVTDTEGNAFTYETSVTGTYQYTVSAGVYSFFSGDAGTVVNINYSASVGPDADPSLVVADLLTNAHYGAGFPSNRVGTLTTYQAYCLATGLLISPVYNQQTSAASMLDDIATNTNSAWVWSSGLLTLVPYGDQSITANGYTYTAPASALYSLTDDDFEKQTSPLGASAAMNDDPVLLTRKRPADQINSVKIECLDRNNQYNPAVIEAKDQALIEKFGLRQSSATQTHLFCNLGAGRLSAQLQLQRQGIMNMYSFTLDQRYIVLDPMDIVEITDTALGLNQQWVRIVEIQENDDATLSFSAEEYLGNGHAPAFSFQQGRGYTANYNQAPDNPNTPVIFEPTAELAESLEVWLIASGDATWGGADVWISYDDVNYKNVGRINGSARTGLLTAVLQNVPEAPTGQTIDTSSTLSVDLSQSSGQLLSTTQVNANNLTTLSYADGEYIAYQNATLNAAYQYGLTYLVRGAYGSTIKAHNAGTQFARLDESVFKFPYAQSYIGSMIYIKLTSFNSYGGGQQTIADVNPYAYTLQGTAFTSPLPNVTNLRTSYVASITQITWDEVTDFRPVLYEIRKGAGWSGAQVMGRFAHPPFNVQGNGSYWVAAYTQPTAGLQVYSENPQLITISGAQITQNVIAEYDEYATGWSGTCGGSAFVTTGTTTGNILAATSYLSISNILNYTGTGYVQTMAGLNGTYEIPVGHEIDIGYVAPCNILISWQSLGQNISDNILTTADYLNAPDILDYAASGNVSVYPEIALSQDGSTWGAWQTYAAGAYVARKFKARMQLQTMEPTIYAILQDFIFGVDVPDRDDHYTNVSIASGGTTITWKPDGAASTAAFNGGPNGASVPAVQVTVLNGSSGDNVLLSSVSLSSGTIQVMNSASGVARNVNILTQGF